MQWLAQRRITLPSSQRPDPLHHENSPFYHSTVDERLSPLYRNVDAKHLISTITLLNSLHASATRCGTPDYGCVAKKKTTTPEPFRILQFNLGVFVS